MLRVGGKLLWSAESDLVYGSCTLEKSQHLGNIRQELLDSAGVRIGGVRVTQLRMVCVGQVLGDVSEPRPPLQKYIRPDKLGSCTTQM